MTQLFYNGDAYPDKPPVTNIWEVTQPEWKGRVMMQNILNDLAWASWATGFCVGDTPAMLEDAYKDLTGEDLVLSEGCENAGYEFLKRLYENEPILLPKALVLVDSPLRPLALLLPQSSAKIKIIIGAWFLSIWNLLLVFRKSTAYMLSTTASIPMQQSS